MLNRTADVVTISQKRFNPSKFAAQCINVPVEANSLDVPSTTSRRAAIPVVGTLSFECVVDRGGELWSIEPDFGGGIFAVNEIRLRRAVMDWRGIPAAIEKTLNKFLLIPRTRYADHFPLYSFAPSLTWAFVT
jgi:hypothetical protein